MTKCLSELQIEQWVLDHIELSNMPEHPHIKTCHLCQSILADFQEYYKIVIHQFEALDHTGGLDLLEKLRSENNQDVFLLNSMHLVRSQRVQQPYRKTLAADGGVKTPQVDTKNVAVFSSSDERLMVRILQGAEGDYSLFLLSEQPNLYQNVLVRIVGMENEYVTDSNGCVRMGKVQLPDLEEIGIEVRTTSFTYDLDNLFPHSELLGEAEITLEQTDQRNLKLEILPEGSNYSLKVTLSESTTSNGLENVKVMVVKENREAEIANPIDGVALFEEISNPSNLHVKIFT